MSRRTRVFPVLLVAVAVAGDVSTAAADSDAPTARTIRVAGVALVRALNASQEVLVPPRASYPRALSRSDGAEMLAQGQRTLRKYFAGQQLHAEQYGLANDVRTLEHDPTFRVVGGGADHLVVTRADVGGTSVRLVGTVRVWQKMAQVQPPGQLVLATPSNTLDVTALVAVSDAGTRVTGLSLTFHPGSGP